MDFGEEWDAIEARLRRYCESRLRDRDLASELLQVAHIEAWRGYHTFQRRSSFLTWVTSIARRQIDTVLSAHSHGIKWDGQAEFAYAPPEPAATAGLRDGFLSALVRAVEAGDVTTRDAVICKTYLAHPDSTWAEVASQVDASATHCAVIYMRAMSKVRVALFLSGDSCLGGRVNVVRALVSARMAVSEERLTAQEEQAFREAVLEHRHITDAIRRSADLREACRKVALQILKD